MKPRQTSAKMEAEYLRLYKETPIKANDLLQQFSDEVLTCALDVADELQEEHFTRLTADIQQKYLFHGA